MIKKQQIWTFWWRKSNKQNLPRWKFIENRGSYFINKKSLYWTQIAWQQGCKAALGSWKIQKTLRGEGAIWKTVKRTIQTLYDRGLFDNCDHADVVLKHYLFIDEVNNRRWADLEELIDDENVIQSFC